MTPPQGVPAIGRTRRPRGSEETRDRVLDAAEECYARFGIAQTTIDDVVRVARIPRATLYRHAGGRDDLVAAVALREIDRFFAKLGRHIANFDTVPDVLVEGTLFAVDHYRSHDLLAATLTPDSRPHGLRVPDDAAIQAWDQMVAFVTPMIDAGHQNGTIRADLTATDATEWLIRVIGAFVVMESPWLRTRDDHRALLHRGLVPIFVPNATSRT